MLTGNDVRDRLQQRPFVPFRLVMSSGQFYDIQHPDLVLVGKRHVFVGTAREENPTEFDRSSLLSILHLAAIENLPTEKAAAQSNGQG
jgi:hypothetical protein